MMKIASGVLYRGPAHLLEVNYEIPRGVREL